MTEKNMMTDTLTGLKASIASYAKMIVECDDDKLRETFIQMRNGDEAYQFQLYKLAKQKGFCNPAQGDTPSQLQKVKASLTEALNMKNGAGPAPVLG